MDLIFKALNDPTRRALLDALRAQDGQSLGQLEAVSDLTRFGVMKHLALLEEAGLIVTRKVGRFKYHYLNIIPLQEVIDRWIEPLVRKPLARGLLDLKQALETDDTKGGNTMTKPDFMMQTFIRCTQDALWDALTEPDQMAAYHFMANRVEKEGDTYSTFTPNGNALFRTRTLSTDPKSRIEATWEPQWEGGGKPSRTVFLIVSEGDYCKLTLEHYDLTFPVVPGTGVSDGWARWAASLKTWLETGKPLRMKGPSGG